MDHLLSREKSVRKKNGLGSKPQTVLASLLFSFERLDLSGCDGAGRFAAKKKEGL
jgi:hypothetical protein